MSKKLYVGNLPYSVNDEKLNEMFASFGAVTSAQVISDKFSGRSKGFGFVEFENAEEADKAAGELDGKEVEGRTIKVNEAEQRKPRERGGFRGGNDRGRGRNNW